MKKLLVLYIFSLLFLGCADSIPDMPQMEITGIYISGDENETNYANKYHTMPILRPGDEVDILFDLKGNGNDLRTFIVSNENSNIQTSMWFMADEVSDEFSDFDKGNLVFVDGVSETGLTVKAKITGASDDASLLTFYLFSKATACSGAELRLAFTIEDYK
ncbi:DUF5035 family protein [Bacteroides sp. OttesenSCG-928-J23]|nr:DUF5035 family protein [Bacteroides sp. OttesenSCG-928-J23]MDL2299836.1 DUF5035 family protein [Bacteroides sp. OttesenSCG-928-E20]MDL2306023.1 DUF5035 family protein [Bacteroides sp. OttesenSCG-928-D19]